MIEFQETMVAADFSIHLAVKIKQERKGKEKKIKSKSLFILINYYFVKTNEDGMIDSPK